jgi:hypothetical protein
VVFIELRKSTIFLKLIKLDHIANLIKIHLPALSLSVDQINTAAEDFISSPISFLKCITKNQIPYTFAPNFFLSPLQDIPELDPPNSSVLIEEEAKDEIDNSDLDVDITES